MTGGSITDVAGILVGHHHRIGAGWATGVTVVLTPPRTVGGVDVRGGGPGTRETDLLDPSTLVEHVAAGVLGGGSAYGGAAADGVVRWLAARGRGFPVGPTIVPIVPAAVLFDLPLNDWVNTPDAAFGAAACDTAAASGVARTGVVEQGSVGAGAGATAGRLKGGVGTASQVTGTGHTVGALVAANPMGEVVDPETGLPWSYRPAWDFGLRLPDQAEVRAAAAASPRDALNTTIGVVATDAALTKSQCRRLAMAAHDGLARAVRPAHTLYDGDTVFALATGGSPGPAAPDALAGLCAAAADVFERAVVAGVLHATSVAGVTAHRERYPSAYG